jgi:hypothetical protein
MRIPTVIQCIAMPAGLAAFTSAAVAGAEAGPHIAAKPSVVEVNQATTLTGTGFAADERVMLKECARTGWLAPQYPCDSRTVTVKTDATGGFTVTFEVKSCSGVRDPEHVHKCYVGNCEMGEDGGALIGAAKLTATP